MPIAETRDALQNCINKFPQSLLRQHFVIHEAYLRNKTDQYEYFPINNMIFKVSFITKSGIVDVCQFLT